MIITNDARGFHLQPHSVRTGLEGLSHWLACQASRCQVLNPWSVGGIGDQVGRAPAWTRKHSVFNNCPRTKRGKNQQVIKEKYGKDWSGTLIGIITTKIDNLFKNHQPTSNNQKRLDICQTCVRLPCRGTQMNIKRLTGSRVCLSVVLHIPVAFYNMVLQWVQYPAGSFSPHRRDRVK